MKLFYTVLLAIVVAALLPSPVLSWRIYALSNNLDVWQGGAWKTIPLMFGNVTGTYFVDQFIAPTQIGHDLTGDVFVTALNGVQGQRPFVTTDKVDYSTNTFIGSSFYIGRWAFDASNNFYSVNRYSPAPPPLNPIIKMPSASYNDNFGPFIGQATGTRDITSFRKGTAMVMVGAFTQVFNGNGTNPVDARNVALYNVGTGKWQALGAGIPYPPWRIVSDGTQLIALTNTSTLWRWNSTSKAWRSYQLTLTSSRGTPSIADLDFGGDKLFLVGNFDRVNGVGVRNVTMLSFGTAGALKVTGIGIGLPGGNRYCISARSASQVFVGGSTNGKKVVYEWRKGRAVPWDRIGSLGFSSGDAPVVAVTVVG